MLGIDQQFIITCLIWFGSTQTCGRSRSSSGVMSMFSRCAGRSTMRTVSSMIWLRSENFFSGGLSRAKSSSRRMMLAQRFVSRMTMSMSSASWLPSGHLLPQQRGECQHARQRIVQFVRDTGGEQADRGQLFAAHRFRLRNRAVRRCETQPSAPARARFAQLGLRLAQRRGHRVECFRHLGEFVPIPQRDFLLQVSRRNAPGAGPEIAQRQIDQAMHEEAHRQRRQDNEAHGRMPRWSARCG